MSDPTGGAYTAPTSLFVPAAALPTLNARVTLGVDVRSAGSFDPARPSVSAELGLGRGFTVALGSGRWGHRWGAAPSGSMSARAFSGRPSRARGHRIANPYTATEETYEVHAVSRQSTRQ